MGVGALGGGAMLTLHPDGKWLQMPVELLRHSPFHDFLIPGLILLIVIGGGQMLAGGLALAGSRAAPLAGALAGATLLGWILVEMALLRSFHWLHAVYLALGAAILVEGVSRWRRARRGDAQPRRRFRGVPRVLVAHGSKRGGTEGIAVVVGDTLKDAGLEVDVLPAASVERVDDYDAVIVGGSLYAGFWHRSARRLIKHNARALRGRPVWLFSSGPLDDSAAQKEIPPTAQVRRLMVRAGARGHVTFGGRLERDAKGFPASAMARKLAGDWRSPERIRHWAAELAAELKPPLVVTRTQRQQRVLHPNL